MAGAILKGGPPGLVINLRMEHLTLAPLPEDEKRFDPEALRTWARGAIGPSWTTQQLANHLGVSYQFLRKILSGHRGLGLDTYGAMAANAHAPLGWCLRGVQLFEGHGRS